MIHKLLPRPYYTIYVRKDQSINMIVEILRKTCAPQRVNFNQTPFIIASMLKSRLYNNTDIYIAMFIM